MKKVRKESKSLKYFKERKGEKIGGGFFVFRRHSTTGRIKIDPKGIPFEHPSYEAALAEANRLSLLNPGKPFCVVRAMRDVWVEHIDPPDAQLSKENAEKILEQLAGTTTAADLISNVGTARAA